MTTKVNNRMIDGASINVLDFGAVGDGITDNTAAFQAALDEAVSRQKVFTGGDVGGGTYTATRIPVIVPAGDYYLASSVYLHYYGEIRGDARAFLRGARHGEPDGTHFLFDSRAVADGGLGNGMWQYDLSGFSAFKARGLVAFDNDNLDQGHVHIHDIEVKGMDDAIWIENAQSSRVIIENFKSDRCVHFLHNERCDMISVKDGWISQGVLTSNWDSTIRHQRGQMYVQDVIGVPTLHTGMDPSWFSNGNRNDWAEVLVSSLHLDGFRAGGETGSCTLVNNFARADVTYPVYGTGVVIQDCDVFVVNKSLSTNGHSCAIRLFKIPNRVVMTDCTGLVDTDYYVTWWNGDSIPAGEYPPEDNYGANREYRIEHNSTGIKAIVRYDRISNVINLTRLFHPTIYFTPDTTTATTADYYIKSPIPKAGIYQVSYSAASSPAASAAYTNSMIGYVTVTTDYDGSEITVYPEYHEIARTGAGNRQDNITLEAKCSREDGSGTGDSFPFSELGDWFFTLRATTTASGFAGSQGALTFTPIQANQPVVV